MNIFPRLVASFDAERDRARTFFAPRFAARRRHLAAAALLLLGAHALPLAAATPAAGTLSPATPQLVFSSGPHFDSNLGDCSMAPCDDYALTLQLPADYAQTNPGASVRIDLAYTVPGDVDLALLDSQGTQVDDSGELAGLPEQMEIPAGSGTRSYTVRVIPFAVAGATATVTIRLLVPPAPPPPASGLPPRFQVHTAPSALGNDAAEPSVGHNRFTQRAMFISYTQALRMSFRENDPQPLPVACDATWEDKSGTLTTLNTLDPILFTDEATGRTFNSQLSGANSLFEFTDDDGENWSPGQIAAPNGGADHQSVASGPYPAGQVPPTASWPASGAKRAVYYCSQSVASAFCSRSDDGGLTFGPGMLVKNPDCSVGSLQGHVKVAPDGTVYLPDSSQCLAPLGETAEKVVAFVSNDAGVTWAVRPLPESQGGAASDPSVGIATDGTAYMCYENADGRVRVAVSHDEGATWINDQDIGAALGIVASRFPQAIAGDPDRAACAFLGTTTTTGDPAALTFQGIWHPYVATTYDGGETWHLVNASPSDPIQGHGGVGPSGTNRNLLDFNDLQIDDQGRLLFALADGCTGGCVKDPAKNSFGAKATLIRQTGGRTLFAAFDDDAGTQYNSTAPILPAPACADAGRSLRTVVNATVQWNAPDTGGSPITNYRVYRATSLNGSYALVGESAGKTQFVDTEANPSVPEYYYRVVAENAQGDAPVSNTIVLPLSASPPVVDTCTLPGDVIAVDTIGDGTVADTDIAYVAVAEPEAYAGFFVVTLKIADFTTDQPPQGTFYPILFPIEGNKYIALDVTQGPAKFVHGTYMDVAQGVLAFTEVGLLDARSTFTADGTIRLVVPKSLFGNPPAGAILAGFDARTRVGLPSATSRDTAGPADYTVRGTAVCAIQPDVLGALFASVQTGNAPLTVTFTVTGSPPPGKTLSSFNLDFGDGSSSGSQTFGGASFVEIEHTYQDEGTYRARLTVTDSGAATSTNLAERTIEVGTSATDIFADGFEQ